MFGIITILQNVFKFPLEKNENKKLYNYVMLNLTVTYL